MREYRVCYTDDIMTHALAAPSKDFAHRAAENLKKEEAIIRVWIEYRDMPDWLPEKCEDCGGQGHNRVHYDKT